MSNGYNFVEGSREDIISLNDEDHKLESSSFTINIDSSRFSDQIYTQNYIQNLFSTLEQVCQNCQTIVDFAKSYFNKNADVSLIQPPEIMAFDFDVSGSFDSNANKFSDTSQYKVGTVNITGGTLNLRSTPNGEIIGSLQKGANLKIIGSSADPNWLEIELNDGRKGYVSSKYISMKQISTDTSFEVEDNLNIDGLKVNNVHTNLKNLKSSNDSSLGKVKLNSGSLNVREVPNGNIISSLKNGEVVSVIGRSESDPNWVKIRLNSGEEAYVFSKYLEVSNEKKN